MIDKNFLRKIIYAFYFVMGLLIYLEDPSFVKGSVPFVLTFLIWIFGLIYVKTKSEVLFKIALGYLLLVPVFLIKGTRFDLVEHFTVFIYELLVLGVLQEILLLIKYKYITPGK